MSTNEFSFYYLNNEYDKDDIIRLFIIERIPNMQPGGQSIVDRLLAAKNTIAGQPVAKFVCKATTEEIMGPKRKHLDCKNLNIFRTISFLSKRSFTSITSNACFNS